MTSNGEPRVRPVPLGRGLDLVPAEQIERIHEASMRVLWETGVNVRSERVAKSLEVAGAKVDHDELRVRFPAELIEEALALAPRSYMLAGRDPVCDVVLDGSNAHLTLDGCASDVLDIETGVKRPSTKADLEAATRLADAVPEIAIIWQPVAARDVPTADQPMHEVEAQLRNTTKHIQQMTAIEPHHARAAVEMAAAVAGGETALRERPILSAFQCSLSPLTFDGGPLEAALVYAEAGVPSGWVAMPLTGATAPMTVAGTLVLQNAELVAGMAMLELLVPGTKTFYGVCTSTMDLNSGSLSLGWGPEEQLFSFASAALARRYGVPSSIGTFGTGAKTHDWQAGMQHATSWFTTLLSNPDMVCATGTIYGGRVFAFETPILDSELIGITRRMLEGLSTSPQDFALDVIDEVGPGGHFLGQRHTLENMRRLWQTQLFDRQSWEEWEAAGRPEPKHRARERAREILATHEVPPLPDGAEEAIRRIMGEAAVA